MQKSTHLCFKSLAMNLSKPRIWSSRQQMTSFWLWDISWFNLSGNSFVALSLRHNQSNLVTLVPSITALVWHTIVIARCYATTFITICNSSPSRNTKHLCLKSLAMILSNHSIWSSRQQLTSFLLWDISWFNLSSNSFVSELDDKPPTSYS